MCINTVYYSTYVLYSRTLYRYRSGPATDAIKLYGSLASKYGIPLTEMALRWSRERQLLTTALVGHTSMDQLNYRYFNYTVLSCILYILYMNDLT